MVTTVEQVRQVSRPVMTAQGLIVTRTPLRVSFAGGGTDLPDFYEEDFGAVFSTAIDKYVYVTVKQHGPLFDEKIRLNYFESEHVQDVDEIRNNIARECLKLLRIEPPIYISTVADLPASSGLGGSSAFAIGLLHALHGYRGERVSAGQLAEEACHIEIEVLGEPIGRQDQYAAAFGGLNLFRFQPGGRVTVEPQYLSNGNLQHLFDHLLMFWTGVQRNTRDVLGEQKENVRATYDSLATMREHAIQLQDSMARPAFDPAAFGRVLDETWRLKRGLSSQISGDTIDTYYDLAMGAGAEGGKILGAGGGGFLLFVVRPERQAAVRAALASLTEIPIRPEVHGSQLIVPFMSWRLS